MSFDIKVRGSDSPYVETIAHGFTLGDGRVIRPAESRWYMVLSKRHDATQLLVVGPHSASGTVTFSADAEILWIRFRLGTFMPHLPTREILNMEQALPAATHQSFWLHGSAWQFPTFENVDTFVARLARDGALARDPLVDTALQGQAHDLSPRTVRHRFLRATGQTQGQIQQFERAQRAAALLQSGASILDAVDEAGYFDQPHLTRSLRRWIGHTPAQLLRADAA